MSGKTLWLMGYVLNWPEWEFMGIFSSKEKAETALSRENEFYCPVVLDELESTEVRDFENVVWFSDKK